MYFSLYYFLEEDRWDLIKAIKYYVQNVFKVCSSDQQLTHQNNNQGLTSLYHYRLTMHIDTMFLYHGLYKQ